MQIIKFKHALKASLYKCNFISFCHKINKGKQIFRILALIGLFYRIEQDRKVAYSIYI